MKTLVLYVALLIFSVNVSSQITVIGISPAPIEGFYNHTWAQPVGGWGTPDFNIPGTFVQDTLMLVEDGTPGINAQGNPISQEGCNPLINDLTGKIAVIYRNSCEFALKALNAENAGAVGVIIINNTSTVTGMGAGVNGSNVTIPVVMINDADGDVIVNQMGIEPVVMLLGNLTGYYDTNLSIGMDSTLIAPYSGFANQINSSFPTQVKVVNNGILVMDGDVTISIDGAIGGQVYSNMVNVNNLNPGESLVIPLGTAGPFPDDEYTITYEVNPLTTDEFLYDNTLEVPFKIQSDVLSFAELDVNNKPISSSYFKWTSFGYYSNCFAFQDPNADSLSVTGIYFSAWIDTLSYSFDGTYFYSVIYEWNDVFTDINDIGFGFNNFSLIDDGEFIGTSNSQVKQNLYIPFQNQVNIANNQRYLVCLQTYNTEISLGITDIDYSGNMNATLQPHSIVEIDGTYYLAPANYYTSIGLAVMTCSESSGSESVSACDSYTWPADGNTYSSTGSYIAVIPNSMGCDSTVTLNLTIDNGFSNIETVATCDNYTWPFNGTTYTASTIVNETFTAVNGCDSTYTLNLTIHTVDNGVSESGIDLTAVQAGASYQWLNCSGMTPISGATNQTYTAIVNGDYAVIVDNNGCIDTSSCYSVTEVGIVENDFGDALFVYPNPTDGNFSIDLGETYKTITLTITDINGKRIRMETFFESQLLNLKLEEPSGVYLLTIESGAKKAVIRLVKE